MARAGLVVMAYRLELASHMPPPETHRDLLDLLTHYRHWLDDRVVSYSPRESGVGYTLFQQDARYTPRAWDLIAAMGAANINLETTTQRMLAGLSEVLADPVAALDELGVPNVERAARTSENFAMLLDRIASGELAFPVAQTFPLDDIVAAFTAVESSHAPGKIVVIP